MIAELLSDFITRVISSIGYAGVFVLMTLESACIPIPSEVVMPFSGYLAYQGRFNLLAISVVGAAGCMTGSIASYFAGLKGGRPFLEKYGRYILLDHKSLGLAEKWFEKHGDKAVLFSRLLPVIRTVISFPAGIGKFDFKKLVVYSFAGSLPWCFALAYIGFSLGPHWSEIIEFFNQLDALVVAVSAAVIIYFWKVKKGNNR